ncbi:MAG: ABC transporter substrate-binding protein [Anaerolineaceae bacterium]|nr:ABC transporter substrate-binding protein [Anaerolineaceae bacterium]
MMRRTLLMLVVLVCVLPVAIGISAQDDITLDFYFPTAVDGPIVSTIEGYVAQFNEANPGITVVPSYTGSYTQTRDTIVAEGMEPIVDVAVMLSTDLYSFIQEETIVPAQSFIDTMDDPAAFVDDFFPAMLLNSRDADGTIWSIPFQRSSVALYYNADLFEAEGIAVPTNTEELIAAAQALQTEDRAGLLIPVAGGFPTWMYQAFAAGFGQPLTAEDPSVVNFNSEASLDAVTFLTLVGTSAEDGGYGVGPAGGSAWGETPTAFLAGQAAMIYHTSGSLSNLLNNADFTVGVAFAPSGPEGPATVLGGGNMYIFDDGSKTQEELDAAWAFVEFMSSPEIQSDWGVASGYVAARQSAWDMEPLASRVEEFPQYGVTRDQLDVAVMEFSSYDSINIDGIVNSTLSGILSGEVPLEEAQATLDTAQAQIDGLLDAYR